METAVGGATTKGKFEMRPLFSSDIGRIKMLYLQHERKIDNSVSDPNNEPIPQQAAVTTTAEDDGYPAMLS